MTTRHPALSEAELDRTYSHRIRPDLVDGVSPSRSPTAVLVAGQPGSGRPVAVAKVRAHLVGSVGPAVLVSSDELRHYHPHWRKQVAADVHAAAGTRADVGRWFAQASADAVTARTNIVLETGTGDPQAALSLARMLKGAQYDVSAVVLAVDRDRSRQATMARYDVARSAGDTPQFITAADHDQAYERVRDALALLEVEHAIDRLQVVAPDGRQLYANELVNGRWARRANGLDVLDDFRERRLTTKELADSALRWLTLAQRLAGDPDVPREVAGLVIAWRNEAIENAERDPQAKRLLDWGREAEAFRTMDRYRFLREFPQHAKAVERLDEAHRYAEKNFERADDRQAFIAQTRARLADRIAEGRYAASDREPPERGARSR